jgi:hypothetical protein
MIFLAQRLMPSEELPEQSLGPRILYLQIQRLRGPDPAFAVENTHLPRLKVWQNSIGRQFQRTIRGRFEPGDLNQAFIALVISATAAVAHERPSAR